jgi:hypothetical protein
VVAKPPARLAAFDVPAERRGAAGLDRAHRPVLHRDQAVGCLIRCAVACEDLGQFDLGSCRIRVMRMRTHRGLRTRGAGAIEQVER